MISEDRFVTFKDTVGTEHTVRIMDIQAVGVSLTKHPNTTSRSYIRAHDYAAPVTSQEAERVRTLWLKEG